jgi:[ribosomal protein S5]-alanine N-acetyltransferase
MNFPSIETERLILGKIETKDISNIILYANNSDISDNILNVPNPFTKEDAISLVNRQVQGYEDKTAYVFGIFLKEFGEFTGIVSLHLDKISNKAEMGYWIGVPFRNKGIATASVQEVLAFGFNTLKLNKIFATHFTDNISSGKVLINAGMIKEAVLKEHYLKNGLYKDVVQYRLTKHEYHEINDVDR